MIIGIGIDIVEVARIGRMVDRHGARFLDKVYTSYEVENCQRRGGRAQEYAARWAAKEALMKAVGTGWRRGVLFRDIENYNLPSGKPMIRLRGRVKQLAQRLGGRRIHVSISHEREYAVAFVVLEG
ncbi:MAG: holo-ACP synthase [Armatimonadota bacterium]